MNEIGKFNRKLSLLLFTLLLLSITLNLLRTTPSYAVYSYGYKKDETYDFTMQMSSTTNTEHGKSTASTTYGTSITIKDIQEDSNGYRIEIKYFTVTPSASFIGMDGDTIIYEGSMEGDPRPFIGGSGSGTLPYLPAKMFLTTDWDLRGTEWTNYIDNNFDRPGYMIQDRTSENGVFTVNMKLDVDAAHSEFDFNGDDTKDAYTGTISEKIEYDSNGVLSSASMQANLDAGTKGSIVTSMSGSRGQPSALGVGDALVYVAVAVVGIVALFVGYFVGKGGAGRRIGSPQSQAPPPPS